MMLENNSECSLDDINPTIGFDVQSIVFSDVDGKNINFLFNYNENIINRYSFLNNDVTFYYPFKCHHL